MEISRPIKRHTGTAASLGSMTSTPRIAPEPYVVAPDEAPSPSRFSLISRSGQYWSYPYAYVSLVECLAPDLVTIFCNCENLSKIEIKGHGLDTVAVALNNQSLLALTESDHADFAQSGVVVVEILVQRKDAEQKSSCP